MKTPVAACAWRLTLVLPIDTAIVESRHVSSDGTVGILLSRSVITCEYHGKGGMRLKQYSQPACVTDLGRSAPQSTGAALAGGEMLTCSHGTLDELDKLRRQDEQADSPYGAVTVSALLITIMSSGGVV